MTETVFCQSLPGRWLFSAPAATVSKGCRSKNLNQSFTASSAAGLKGWPEK
ncbi:hypothetical protein AB0F88_25935 [Streptosporangium sp. NPDC023963]|uniref:hypothetical protein n=1 Tax=Streptosporangium sp. NPDC023963 TaxID=3155608 RepID=UPI0034404A10